MTYSDKYMTGHHYMPTEILEEIMNKEDLLIALKVKVAHNALNHSMNFNLYTAEILPLKVPPLNGSWSCFF